jgi:hypothetical protein
VQGALVEQDHRLVGEPRRQRADLERSPPRVAALGDHRFRRPRALVEIVEDRRALDHRLAVVQHQRRHPPQRIVGHDLVAVAERRPRPMLEGDIIELQRNADATDEGGIELADEDHGGNSGMLL